jgi:hypothetical protein
VYSPGRATASVGGFIKLIRTAITAPPAIPPTTPPSQEPLPVDATVALEVSELMHPLIPQFSTKP